MSIRMLFKLNKPRLVLVALLALFAACSQQGGSQGAASKTEGSEKTSAPTESLIVSAAASTKEVVEALADKFHASTGTDVKVNPGPSSGLASQIIADAPADLFLSASQQWADEVNKNDKATAMVRLLTNKLVIVVPSANPGGVK